MMSVRNRSTGKNRSWLRRILISLGIGFLGLVVVEAATLYYGRSRDDRLLREAVAEMDRIDPNWTLEGIEAQRVTLPRERNSAEQVLAAKKLLPTPWPRSMPTAIAPDAPGVTEAVDPPAPQKPFDGRVTDRPAEMAFDSALAEELRAELREVEPAVSAARRLVDMPQGRYPVTWRADWIGTLLPCQDARSIGQLLILDAALLAHDGNADSALRSNLAGLNCARSIGDEPTAISQLVRIAVTAISIASLERTLAQTTPSSAALESIQRELEKEIDVPILLYIARGERAGQHRLHQGLVDGTIRLSQLTGPSSGVFDRLEDMQGATMARRAIPKMLRYMTDFVEAAKLPPDQQPERLRTIVPALDNTRAEDILLGMMLSSLDQLPLAHRRQQAILRTAAVAMAAERYRRDHAQWPALLADLVPKYLAGLPVDPFDGRPLRLAKFRDGVAIYSVGYDLLDNGGIVDRKRMTQPGTDIGFRLWDVPARRQIAMPAPMPREILDTEDKP